MELAVWSRMGATSTHLETGRSLTRNTDVAHYPMARLLCRKQQSDGACARIDWVRGSPALSLLPLANTTFAAERPSISLHSVPVDLLLQEVEGPPRARVGTIVWRQPIWDYDAIAAGHDVIRKNE